VYEKEGFALRAAIPCSSSTFRGVRSSSFFVQSLILRRYEFIWSSHIELVPWWNLRWRGFGEWPAATGRALTMA